MQPIAKTWLKPEFPLDRRGTRLAIWHLPQRRTLTDNRNQHKNGILWITAGLGCDGDTIAMTAASQPSIEDLVLGGIPGVPKVHFHNPFLAYEAGEDK
jgi:hypothetical protein